MKQDMCGGGDEMTRSWRKLHNEELHIFCSSPSIIRTIKSRRMRWAGHPGQMRKKRNAHRILVGKPEGKRPLRKPKRRWVDNIKMKFRELGWGGMDLINMVQGRYQWRALANTVMKLVVP
jgi:hypothetical protein